MDHGFEVDDQIKVALTTAERAQGQGDVPRVQSTVDGEAFFHGSRHSGSEDWAHGEEDGWDHEVLNTDGFGFVCDALLRCGSVSHCTRECRVPKVRARGGVGEEGNSVWTEAWATVGAGLVRDGQWRGRVRTFRNVVHRFHHVGVPMVVR